MDRILDSLKKMNNVIDKLNKDGFRRVPDSPQWKRYEKIRKTTIASYGVIVLSMIILLFVVPASARAPIVIALFSFALGAVMILGIVSHLYETRKLLCENCEKVLKRTTGEWIDIENRSRRIVTYSCDSCRQYFFSSEEVNID